MRGHFVTLTEAVMHLIEYNPERVLEFSNSVRLWVRL